MIKNIIENITEYIIKNLINFMIKYITEYIIKNITENIIKCKTNYITEYIRQTQKAENSVKFQRNSMEFSTPNSQNLNL